MNRISAGTLLLGIMAVLFGLLGAYVVRKQLLRPPVADKTAPTEKLLTVPVANGSLPSGRKITLGDIAILKLSNKDAVAKGYDKPFMANTQQIIGRVLRRNLEPGQTFDSSTFYPEGMGPNVAEKLKAGYRAVTVQVEANEAVAGFATPGSFVDVLFRSEADAANEVPETTITLIEGAQVVAFNQETFEGARGAHTDASGKEPKASVTLAVTPDQAASVRVVQDRGLLSLTLRNPEDSDAVGSVGPKTLDELLQRRKAKHRIEVYRGRQMTKVDFRRNDRVTDTPPPAIADIKANLTSNGAPTLAQPNTTQPTSTSDASSPQQ